MVASVLAEAEKDDTLERMHKLTFKALIFSLLPLAVAAQPFTDRNIAPQCSQTPQLSASGYPGFSKIHSHNRLAMPAGKAQPAPGQLVYLFGRVFDRNCVPVSEASVEIWQNDAMGKRRFSSPASLATPYPEFTGGGRTRTDNLGQFHFLSVYPGATGKQAPHIMVRVDHPRKRQFNTRLYFAGDYRNQSDPSLKRMSFEGKQLVTMHVMPREGDWQQGIQAYVDIVLPDASAFRKF